MGMASGVSVERDTFSIFIVDDDQTQLQIYQACLQDAGYRLHLASSSIEACDRIVAAWPDLVILDIQMPLLDGFDLLRRLRLESASHGIPVIMASSLSDMVSINRAFELGAVDYIRKPFTQRELLARLGYHVDNISLKKKGGVRSTAPIPELDEQFRSIANVQQTAIFALAKLAESRDPETGAHLERIREYVKVLARYLSRQDGYRDLIDDAFIQHIFDMSVLHDIGKVGIPDHILLKPGKLTPEEFEVMKTQSLIGGDALDSSARLNFDSAFLEMGRDIALCHHEHWKGTGYPYRLAGTDIPLAARITAVADVYDAISFPRVYRPVPLSEDAIEKIMESEAGTLFDPGIYAAYVALRGHFRKIRRTIC